MGKMKIEPEYEVLSPWADADPIPLKKIAERPNELSGKTIGLFRNSKRAAPLIFTALQNNLKSLFPSIKFSPFSFMPNNSIVDTDQKARFESWLKEVDAVVFAYGD